MAQCEGSQHPFLPGRRAACQECQVTNTTSQRRPGFLAPPPPCIQPWRGLTHTLPAQSHLAGRFSVPSLFPSLSSRSVPLCLSFLRAVVPSCTFPADTWVLGYVSATLCSVWFGGPWVSDVSGLGWVVLPPPLLFLLLGSHLPAHRLVVPTFLLRPGCVTLLLSVRVPCPVPYLSHSTCTFPPSALSCLLLSTFPNHHPTSCRDSSLVSIRSTHHASHGLRVDWDHDSYTDGKTYFYERQFPSLFHRIVSIARRMRTGVQVDHFRP